MSTEDDSKGLVVGYDESGLRGLLGAEVIGALMGVALTLIGYFTAPEGLNPTLATYVPKALGPLLLVLCACLAVGTLRSFRGGPALVVQESGLTVGFLPGPPFELGWKEVLYVGRREYPVNGHAHESLAILVRDRDALVGRLKPVARLAVQAAILTGQPPLGYGLRLLDRSWPEIEAAVGRFHVNGSFMDECNAIVARFQASRTHDGDLVVADDYRRTFRRAPLGHWDDCVHSPSPGDSLVSFCADGTGSASTGASGFMGYATDLQWRERDADFEIDVRRAERDAPWFTFGYSFQEHEGEVTIMFDERFSEETDDVDDAAGDPDEWTMALYAAMTYGGPC